MEKPGIERARLILAIMFILGGCICVIVFTTVLRELMGITFVMLGTFHFFEATKGFRDQKRKNERPEIS